MEKEIHIVYRLEATKNTEDDVDIYTTPKGWDLLTEKISVAFDTNVDYDLEVSFYKGIQKVAPTDGVYIGKALSFGTDRKIRFEEDSVIRLHYKNTNATTDRNAVIEIVGKLVSEEKL